MKFMDAKRVENKALNIVSEVIKNTFFNLSFGMLDEADAYNQMENACAYYLATMIEKNEINLVDVIQVSASVSKILYRNFEAFSEKDEWGTPVLLEKVC